MKNFLKTHPFICNTRSSWESVKMINTETSLLVQMGDIHPFYTKPVINSESVVLDLCDKNFVYYWLNKEIFPNMKLLILNSHPCEPSIVSFLENESEKGTIVYVTELWASYFRKWGLKNHKYSQIRIITNEKYEQLYPEGFLTSVRN
jgi:hypothetical protein